jgi:hypothetical protein
VVGGPGRRLRPRVLRRSGGQTSMPTLTASIPSNRHIGLLHHTEAGLF